MTTIIVNMESATTATTTLRCRQRTMTWTTLWMVVALAGGCLVGPAHQAMAWSLVDRFTFGGSMFPENHRGGNRSPIRMRRRSRRFMAADEEGHPHPTTSNNNNNNNNSPTSTTTRQRNSISNHQTQRDMIRFMDRPMTSTVGDWNTGDEDVMVVLDDALRDLVHCIVRAADGRKAEQIVALQVHHISTLASVLVILSGNSRPQNQAIAAAITKAVAEEFQGQRPGGKGVPEGSAESGWMLLDYGSVMVHIMTPKSRLFYNVEGQWKDKGGIYWDLNDILIPNKVEQLNDDNNRPYVAKEEDPFWS